MPTLHHFDGLLRARRHAQAAPRAPIVHDLVLLVRPRLDGPQRTYLRAQRAARARVEHAVVDQGPARSRRTPPVPDVRLELVPETGKLVSTSVGAALPGPHDASSLMRRPSCSRVSRSPGLPCTLADAFEDLQHATSIDAADRAGPAHGLRGAQRPARDLDDAVAIIQNDQCP